MGIYIFLAFLFSLLFGWPGFIVWHYHRFLWKNLPSQYGWSSSRGKYRWRAFMVKDHMRGDYRGRKFDFSYKFLCQTSFESRGQSWHTQIQIMTHSPPDGRFKLDQKRFFKKAGPPIGDRYFDKHTKIVKEKPRGYVGEFFSDPVLRKRVAKFFVYPSMEDRTISLTPTGRLKLDDSGLFLSRKRLLKNLDLLTDLAEIVENPEHDET